MRSLLRAIRTTLSGMVVHEQPTSADGQEEALPNPVSLDIVYEQVLRSIDAQQTHLRAVDAKASFVLTAASIIIGFQGLPGTSGTLGIRNPAWLIPAFAVYIALLLTIFQAYRLRDFKSSGMEPAELQTYYFDSAGFTKRQFIATMRSAYEQNIVPIDQKVRWLQWAERLLLVQVISLLLGGILSREWSQLGSWVQVGLSWTS